MIKKKFKEMIRETLKVKAGIKGRVENIIHEMSKVKEDALKRVERKEIQAIIEDEKYNEIQMNILQSPFEGDLIYSLKQGEKVFEKELEYNKRLSEKLKIEIEKYEIICDSPEQFELMGTESYPLIDSYKEVLNLVIVGPREFRPAEIIKIPVYSNLEYSMLYLKEMAAVNNVSDLKNQDFEEKWKIIQEFFGL